MTGAITSSIDVSYRLLRRFDLIVPRLCGKLATKGRYGPCACREASLAGKTPWDRGQARELIEARRGEPGVMLPILHELQERYGYIDDAAIPIIAEALNVSKAETIGVVSFYHDFRREPVDAPVLKLCGAESCQALGCEELVAHLARAHGVEVDGHEQGPLAVETVYCLGHCALSPAALFEGEPIGRLDHSRLDAIVAEARGRPR